MSQELLGKLPTDGKRKQVLCLLSDTGRDCSHGAWADGKQTHFPLMKICAEKAPNARVRGATRSLTS